ncbi:MAG: NUDIX domain-containing protein, partial [Parahaliea sp.]
ATLCTRSKPRCQHCPVAADCGARAKGAQADYPGRKPKKALPVRQTIMLLAINGNGDVYLEQRPQAGIWGGLWCFPELEDPDQVATRCIDLWSREPERITRQAAFRHTFSHYHLDITPVLAHLPGSPGVVMASDRQLW